MSGTWIGGKITNRGGADKVRNPYLAAVVGLLILQIVSLIPFVGGFLAVVAALYGAELWRSTLSWDGEDVGTRDPAGFELKA